MATVKVCTHYPITVERLGTKAFVFSCPCGWMLKVFGSNSVHAIALDQPDMFYTAVGHEKARWAEVV